MPYITSYAHILEDHQNISVLYQGDTTYIFKGQTNFSLLLLSRIGNVHHTGFLSIVHFGCSRYWWREYGAFTQLGHHVMLESWMEHQYMTNSSQKMLLDIGHKPNHIPKRLHVLLCQIQILFSVVIWEYQKEYSWLIHVWTPFAWMVHSDAWQSHS